MDPFKNNIFLILTVILTLFKQGECRPSTLMNRIQSAIDRAYSYGYEILGYDQPVGYQPPDNDFKIKQKDPLWDGEIIVPDFLSTMGDYMGYGSEPGKEDRVVKGWDKRYGFRFVLPSVGDFQVVRELGPGRFTDELGPGKFEYSTKSKNPSHNSYDSYSSYHVISDNEIQQDYSYLSKMKNYPWYRK